MVSIARPDRAFFFIAAACALAYVSLPRDTAYYDRWYQLFPVAAVVATARRRLAQSPALEDAVVPRRGQRPLRRDRGRAVRDRARADRGGAVPLHRRLLRARLLRRAGGRAAPDDPSPEPGARLAEPHRRRHRHRRRRDRRLDVPRAAEPHRRHERARDDGRTRLPRDGRPPRLARGPHGARAGPALAGLRDGHRRARLPARRRRALRVRLAARLVPGRRLRRPLLRRCGRPLGDRGTASVDGRADGAATRIPSNGSPAADSPSCPRPP